MKWIKISDSLPDTEEAVLVYGKFEEFSNGMRVIACYRDHDSSGGAYDEEKDEYAPLDTWICGDFDIVDVTHWTSYPEPPTERDNDNN